MIMSIILGCLVIKIWKKKVQYPDESNYEGHGFWNLLPDIFY